MNCLDTKTSEEKKLDSLLRLSHLLSSSLRINDVLNNAMKGIEECLEAKNSSIYEIDYEKGELFFRLARGDKADDLKRKRMKIGEGIAGWVAQTGRPKVVDSPAQDSHFYDGFDRELGFETQSVLAAPLLSKGTTIGVIQVLNKSNGKRFTTDDLELAQIMAVQIALALENAKLYDQLEEKHRRTSAELARTQERLIQSERQAALSGLAQGIAHQIRNPTMSIGGFARRIVSKAEPDQENLIRYAQVIIEENQRLEELVRQVKFLITLEPVLAPSEVNPVVEQAVQRTGFDQPGLEVLWDLSPNLPRIYLDSNLIATALGEVLKNADEAGASKIHIRTEIAGNLVCLEISDDGSGMDEEDLAAALDPFSSTRAHSLGLGLAVALRIMEAHHGEIEIKSRPGQGSVVTFRLPIQARPQV